jgi:hypothetical protein
MVRILRIVILGAFVLSGYLGMSQSAVISEVYGGGGNGGATYQNDFIELYNPTSSPINLTGWSVQYASTSGTTWQVTNLSNSIPAHGYYLIKEASNAAVGSLLPTADATGTIPMAAGAGKVALVSSTTALSGSCPTGLIDLVGYGTANCFEGTSGTGTISATLSAERKANSTSGAATMIVGGVDEYLGNGQDTNNNSADFITRVPQPQNSANGVEPDLAPPIFTSTYPNTLNITESSLDLIVSLDEVGKVYYVVLSDAAPAPSITQVKAGQDDTGAAVSNSGFVSVTAPAADATKNITGLSPSTSYDIYIVAVDAPSNIQANTVKLDVTTAASTTPLTSPSLSSISFSGFIFKTQQSAAQSYTITAVNLTVDVDVSVTGNYLISTDNVNYVSSLVIDKTVFPAAQTIYVKFNPNGNTGTLTGTITHSSTDAVNKLVTLSAVSVDQFTQNFNDPAFLTNSGWTQYSKIGAQVWASTDFGHTCLTGCNSATADKAAQINGFATSALANEDWLITPKLDLTGFSNFPALSFWTISAFAGDALQLKYSSDYTGSGDPALATWTAIDGKFPPSNSSLWTKSANIILPKSSIYLAYVYTSSTAAASRWTLDDWQVADVSSYIDIPVINYGFGEIASGSHSASNPFAFIAKGFGDITVTAPEGYEVSVDNTTFSTSQLILDADATLGKTVYVRFSPASKKIKWDGTLAFTGTGLNTAYGTLTGSSYPKSETLNVTAYNLEFFGADVVGTGGEFGPVNDPLQITNVTTVLQTINADIYGVEEVANDVAFDQLITGLPGYNKILSDEWSHKWDDPTSPNFPAQKIGFIYKNSTAQLIESRVMFKKLFYDVTTGNATVRETLLPGYPSGDQIQFWSSGRLPFMVTFDVTVNGVKKRIRMIDIHAKSGSAQADYDRRKYDVQVLHDSLVARYANDNIIIMGDFNDDVDASINTGSPSSYKVFVDDAANFNVLTYGISQAGAFSFPSSSSFLDHIIISNELSSSYVGNSIIVEDPRTYVTSYTTTTSDHLPVSARFALNVAGPQTITFGSLPAKTYGDAPFNLTATSTSDLAITYTSSDPTIASISGSTATIKKGGTVNITASQAGNAGYTAASDVVQSLTINKASQTLTFTAIPPKNIGDSVFNFTATSTATL